MESAIDKRPARWCLLPRLHGIGGRRRTEDEKLLGSGRGRAPFLDTDTWRVLRILSEFGALHLHIARPRELVDGVDKDLDGASLVDVSSRGLSAATNQPHIPDGIPRPRG